MNDFPGVIAAETTVVKEVAATDDHSDDEAEKPTLKVAAPVKTRKVSTAVYKGADNLPLESKTLANIEMFKDGKYQKFYALSFYVTKTVLVGPKWFWSDQIDLDLTIMIWSWPKWIGHDQNELVATKMNWSGPNCDFCIRNQNRRWKLGQQSAICWNCLGLFSKIEPDFGKIS